MSQGVPSSLSLKYMFAMLIQPFASGLSLKVRVRLLFLSSRGVFGRCNSKRVIHNFYCLHSWQVVWILNKFVTFVGGSKHLWITFNQEYVWVRWTSGIYLKLQQCLSIKSDVYDVMIGLHRFLYERKEWMLTLENNIINKETWFFNAVYGKNHISTWIYHN